MSGKQQISLFAEKQTVKLIKVYGVDWGTTYGETFGAAMGIIELLENTMKKYPVDVKKSIEGIIQTSVNKAKCPQRSV